MRRLWLGGAMAAALLLQLGCPEGRPKDCGDCNDAVACTVDRCDTETGECSHTPQDSRCQPPATCDAVEGCVLPSEACTSDAECDDGSGCTSDTCELSTGRCLHGVLVGLPCDDGDICTLDDQCLVGGGCGGTPLDCEDGDPCTVDECGADGRCSSQLQAGLVCNDGNPCTESDLCQGDGSCVGSPLDCSSTSACRTGTCSIAAGGCVYTNNTGATCNDNIDCTTGDVCQADGTCAGVAAGCADTDPCTNDTCDPATGACLNEPIGGPSCDDGNGCTENDVCQTDGSCIGTPLDCSTGDPCRTGSCDSTAGACTYTNNPGTLCADGNDCTTDDVCQSDGTCAGTPVDCSDGDACTADLCGPGGCDNSTWICLTVGWCRLQFPLTVSAQQGTTETVYGRVFVAGVTDQSDGVDTDPALLAEVGYGPDGSDPSVDATGWTFVAAAANPGWSASTAGEPGNDEYQADLTLPAAGTYDHAYRFSGDFGQTWIYCDGPAGAGADGSEDGYQAANAGDLVTTL